MALCRGCWARLPPPDLRRARPLHWPPSLCASRHKRFSQLDRPLPPHPPQPLGPSGQTDSLRTRVKAPISGGGSGGRCWSQACWWQPWHSLPCGLQSPHLRASVSSHTGQRCLCLIRVSKELERVRSALHEQVRRHARHPSLVTWAVGTFGSSCWDTARLGQGPPGSRVALSDSWLQCTQVHSESRG